MIDVDVLLSKTRLLIQAAANSPPQMSAMWLSKAESLLQKILDAGNKK